MVESQKPGTGSPAPAPRDSRGHQILLVIAFVAISIVLELGAFAFASSAPPLVTGALIISPLVVAAVIAYRQGGGWLRFLFHGFTERPSRGRWYLAPRTDKRD
jgi:hypothetical protein